MEHVDRLTLSVRGRERGPSGADGSISKLSFRGAKRIFLEVMTMMTTLDASYRSPRFALRL
jgi:hypothetical protein